MSYTTVKNNIVDIMEALGYREAKEAINMEDVSSQELGYVFIVSAVSGSLDPEGETLVDRFYDDQLWEIKIAFSKSGNNQVINRDTMNRKRDDIVRELDDHSNWISTVRIQKYQSWEIEELENYFLLTVTVQIIDTVTY